MHPNIKCVDCEKLQRDFMAQTFALVALVLSILQQVSCSYETIPNAPKYYETDRSISLRSNGADWVCSSRKIPTWLRVTNFCINCTSSVCFASSFMQLRNDPNATKYYETDRNISLGSNRVDWVRSLWKIRRDFAAPTLALIAQVHPIMHRVSCSYEKISNAPNIMKRTKTWV